MRVLLPKINDRWQKRLAFLCQAIFSYLFRLCENAKVRPGGGQTNSIKQKEAPKELSEESSQIKIEDEQLDCCVKPIREDLLYVIQMPGFVNKICKIATRLPPVEKGQEKGFYAHLKIKLYIPYSHFCECLSPTT